MPSTTVTVSAPSLSASTTWQIASITSWGCSLWMSWPLLVFVMCSALGTSFARSSCAGFCAASMTYPKSGGVSGGNAPEAMRDGICGPQGRSADSNYKG